MMILKQKFLALQCLQEFTANGLEFLRQEENTFEPEEDEDAGK